MPGLLDYLNTPDAQLGIGLLAAAGPTPQPMSLGQRLAMVTQGLQAQKDNDLRRQLVQSQIGENTSQDAARRAQLARQTRQDAYYLGSDFGAPGAAGQGATTPAAAGAAMTPGSALKAAIGAPANAPAPGQGKFAEWSQQYGIPVDALISDYFSNGGKKIAEMIEARSKPSWQLVNGNLVNTNAPGFSGGIQDQVIASPTGSVGVLRGGANPSFSLVPGSIGAVGDLEDTRNRSAANYQPETVIDPSTGQKVLRPRADVLQPRAAAISGPAVGASGAGYAGGSAAAAAGGQREILQTELGSAQQRLAAAQQSGDAQGAARAQQDVMGIQRELQRLPGAARQPVIGLGPAGMAAPGNVVELSPQQQAQNEAARVKMVDTAKADVVRDTDTQKKAKGARAMIAAADRAMELLKQGPTHSGMGEMVDRGAAFFGKSTPGAQVAAQLDIVSGDLVNNVPRMEGPQSDGDRLEYKTQAGRAADRTLPIDQRLSAMQEVKRLQTKYANLNGGLAEDQAAQPQAQPAGSARSFQNFGYASQSDAIRDAQSAIARGAPRDAVQKRLQSMGLSLPAGAQGGW